MSWLGIIATLGVLIIALLSGIAVWLHYRVYQQQKARQQIQAEQDSKAREQRERINTSIQILAQAVLSDELTLTEASIRISVLLDSLDINDEVRNEFSAFYQLRQRTAHIPILGAWKSLDRQQQKQFDLERWRYEMDFTDFVMDAAQRIRSRRF